MVIIFSLYSLGCLLNELTGRPSCFSDRDNSHPLPLHVDQDAIPDEESRPDTGVGTNLHFPLVVMDPDVPLKLLRLYFTFTDYKRTAIGHLSKANWILNSVYSIHLSSSFHSARMILCRPCLCRFEGRILKQSTKSEDFNQQAVSTCVHSARTMISLLSWTASPIQRIYFIPPWWHTLHYLCEALSALTLEMAYQAHHLPEEAAEILPTPKKAFSGYVT